MFRVAPVALCVLLLLPSARAGEVLPGTSPLTWEGNLPDRLMDGAHDYIDRKIAASITAREQHWHRDTSSPAAYERSVGPNRVRLAKVLGLLSAFWAAKLAACRGV